jgi:hypothetical protein
MFSGSPQDVVLANQLVTAFTTPGNTYSNSYSYNPPTVTWAGVNGATTYSNSSDCSSFQETLMMQSYGLTLKQIEAWTKVSTNGTSYPQSDVLYNAAAASDGFTGFMQISNVQPGDMLFAKYTDSSGDTGHCMMADALPVLVSSTSTQRSYNLTVVDCTDDPHSSDTRISGVTGGVGRGTIRIYTDQFGNMNGWSWSASNGVTIYSMSTRPMIFAKLPAASGSPAWLSAGSQATWNASNDSLAVAGPAAIIADPGSSQQPAVTMNTSGSQLLIMPGLTSVIHLASLTISNGTTATVYDPNAGNLLLDIAANVGNGIVSVDSTSQLDLQSNDMIVHGGSLATINSLIARGYNAAGGGNWLGKGITSSAAASDTTHLTALGAILNTTGTATLYSSFDGVSAASADVLVRHTYYGDTNLDGKVDGTDYSRIDNGALLHLTGWYNGDFNYDGIINGTDYTLLDNVDNTQGGQLVFSTSAVIADADSSTLRAAAVATPTSQLDFTDPGGETLKKIKRRPSPLFAQAGL